MSVAYAAKVLRLDDDGPTVRVPMLAGGQEWGPLATSVPDLVVGDQVIVMALGEATDRLHVLARLQGRPAEQSEVPGLVPRLEAIEARDTGQDARLDGAEAVNGQQGTRLDRVEGRAGALESRAGAIEGVNSTQDGRLSAVETRNTQQDGRLSATEARANAAAPDNTVVHRSGAEQVAGVKTFTDQPVVPPATLAASPIRADDARIVPRICQARYTRADSGVLLARTNVWAQSDWSAITDPYGMFQVGSGATNDFSRMTIPAGCSGYWIVDVRILMQLSPNTTDTIVAQAVRNSVGATASIARDARKFVADGGDHSPVQAHRITYLAAGDVVYWGLYTSVAASMKGGSILGLGTEMTLAYLGPSA